MGFPGPQSSWFIEFTHNDLYFGCSIRKLHLVNHLNLRVGCSACPFIFVQHESALCGLDNIYWSSQLLQLSAGSGRDQQEMWEGKQRSGEFPLSSLPFETQLQWNDLAPAGTSPSPRIKLSLPHPTAGQAAVTPPNLCCPPGFIP